EIRVAELALDDVERDALVRELERVRVAQLVRREAPAHADRGCQAAERDAHPGRRPGVPARRAVDHAEERPDGQFDARLEPRPQLLEAPGIHPDLAPAPALAAAHEQ